MNRLEIQGRDVRLSGLDFGGRGPGALLLHGLAGTASEWSDTASWLTESHRVMALDQRGHGRSERRPDDVSRTAYVRDAVALIEQAGLAPVDVIGQSLGGHTAFLLAAKRPDLVRALVVAEASPTREGPEIAEEIGDYFDSWPLPFPSHEAAVAFFGGESLKARAWARNLATTPDGLRPAFDADVLVAAIAEALVRDYWDEWRAVAVPTLLVRGEQGELSPEEAAAMVAAVPSAQLVSIPGAGHDVHLDEPDAWRAAVEGFLAGVN
jgi:pimeloyl-ACP methyl ester carboxylesterase